MSELKPKPQYEIIRGESYDDIIAKVAEFLAANPGWKVSGRRVPLKHGWEQVVEKVEK